MMARNFFANYMGAVWTTLVQLIVTPFYLRYLGVESYAVVGVHLTVIALFSLLDLGLTPTINREMARLSARPALSLRIRSFLRTVERAYWPLAIGVFAAAIAFLPGPMTAWINPSPALAARLPGIFQIMLVQVGLQALSGFYAAGLLGLQRHVLLNTITAAGLSARYIGGLAVVAFVAPTLEALLSWMALTTAAQLVAMVIALNTALPPGPSLFRLSHLRRNWRYALGVSGIVALSLLLTQIDKLILSRHLPLQEFGLYALAGTVAVALSRPVGPLLSTFTPRFTQLATTGQEAELARLYHLVSQLASWLVVPASLALVVFAPEILAIWLTDGGDVARATPLLRWLTAGFALNALLMLPYSVSLAYGWVRLSLWQNVLSCLAMVPAVFFLVARFGASGGAMAWALLNLGCITITVYFFHRRYLRAEYARWYVRDILPVLAAAAAAMAAGKALALPGWPLMSAALAYILAMVCGLAALGDLRRFAMGAITSLLKRA